MTFYFSLLQTSIRASISKRGAFLIEAATIMANNLIFLTIWWVFFRQFDSIAGWTLSDMMALNAIGNGANGVAQLFFGGVRTLSHTIINGDLDPFMTQPKNILLHVLGSRSLAKGWGNIMTTIIVMILGGFTSIKIIILILLSAFCGGLVFTAFGVIAHSLAFWLDSIQGVAKKYCDALFLFALYPTNIYSGILQIIMFTLIPAGIIGYLPVELIREFLWLKLFLFLASTFIFVFLAFAIFYLGLRKYESGNKFGMRL